MIPRSWVGAAWERVRNHFSSNKIDNSQSDHQMSQPTSNCSDSHHLGRDQCTSSSDSHHLGAVLSTNSSIPTTRVQILIQTKIQTLNKFNLTWLWTMYNLWKIKLGKRVNV